MSNKLYTLKQAAGYLSMPVSTVRSMCHNGEITYVKRQTRNGRVFYIDVVDLDSWIEKNKVKKSA